MHCLHIGAAKEMFRLLLLLYAVVGRSGALLQFNDTKALNNFELIDVGEVRSKVVKVGSKGEMGNYNQVEEVSFPAFGRVFRVLVTPSKDWSSGSAWSHVIDSDGGKQPVPVDAFSIMKGFVRGMQSVSHVQMTRHEGQYWISIDLNGESFTVEPWKDASYPKAEHIIYRDSDVKSLEGVASCGNINPGISDFYAEKLYKDIRARMKRDDDIYSYELEQKNCPMLLVADYRFFQNLGNNSTRQTINYFINIINRVNKLYRNTDFDPEHGRKLSGMGFTIKGMAVHQFPTKVQEGELHYNMEREKWNVKDLLEVFSRQPEHQDYCVSHLFTHQAFDERILGLAYVGSKKLTAIGGICSKEYSLNGYRSYLNTGLSSSKNHYGNTVVTRESELILAHELGHNWGASHDPANEVCSPDAANKGKYIMYTYSVSGLEENNRKFSVCSRMAIGQVLISKSHLCFEKETDAFCGDGRVDDGEDCDAGRLAYNEDDPCCDYRCRFIGLAECSDKNHDCCKNCTRVARGTECTRGFPGSCYESSRCDGFDLECPASVAKPDGVECDQTGQCLKGTCVSLCETLSPPSQSCQLEAPDQACYLSCMKKVGGSNRTSCEIYDETERIMLPNGTPCYIGHCNNGVCEKSEMKIARIWTVIDKIIKNPTLETFTQNIVIIIILISLVLWGPIALGYYLYEKHRNEEQQNEFELKLDKQLEELVSLSSFKGTDHLGQEYVRYDQFPPQ